MSSFFRSANDVTASTEDSSSEDSSEEDSGSENNDQALTGSQVISRIQTLDSTTASASTEDVTSTLTLGNTSASERNILHALIEQRCLKEALADYQNQHGHDHFYTENHPDVQALAQEKYKYMTEELVRHGLIAPDADRGSQTTRERYRQGIDVLSQRAPLPIRPGLPSRPGSSTSLTTAMQDLAIPNSANRPRIPPSTYSHQQLEFYSRSPGDLNSIPPLLLPYVDHPMVELSRYRRDFEEVRIIGKGGYGKVYHVKHRLDGSDYAVKKIGLSAARIRRIQERGQAELDSLLSELRMLARFDHPNIVRYYGGWLEYSLPTPPGASFRQHSLHRLLEAPEPRTDASEMSELSAGRDSSDLNVVFEHTGGEVLGEVDELSEWGDELPELRNHHGTGALRRRRPSESTTASGESKRSTVHSIGEESYESMPKLQEPTESSDIPTTSSLMDTTPVETTQLTLHIQMSLHPLSLAEFLSISQSFGPGSEQDLSNLRHCFHVPASLEILLCIMDGVQYLHQCGVVHRDLKPSNIFLSMHRTYTPACVDLSKCGGCKGKEVNRSAFLNVRIGDFGLVTAIAHPDSQRPTHSPRAVGTELYRPTNATAHADERLDVFALGIIAAELLFPFSTRMERQTKLQELKSGEFADEAFAECLGGRGNELIECIKGMTCSDELSRLTCSEARKQLESLLC